MDASGIVKKQIGAPDVFLQKTRRGFRSGYIGVNYGRLWVSGITGYGWASSSYSIATNAYNLGFYASAVSPSDNFNRWNGFPLRCLARSSYNARSGAVHVNGNRLGNSGHNGYGWSSRGYSDTTYTYYLHFDSSGVNSSANYYRWGAFPLRCLARS